MLIFSPFFRIFAVTKLEHYGLVLWHIFRILGQYDHIYFRLVDAA